MVNCFRYTFGEIVLAVLAVFQGRYPSTIKIQPIKQLQWTDTKATSENFFSRKQQAAVKTDQKIYSLLIYDFIYDLIYDFFLSKDFQSSYITLDIFNNSTFFGTTEKKNEK